MLFLLLIPEPPFSINPPFSTSTPSNKPTNALWQSRQSIAHSLREFVYNSFLIRIDFITESIVLSAWNNRKLAACVQTSSPLHTASRRNGSDIHRRTKRGALPRASRLTCLVQPFRPSSSAMEKQRPRIIRWSQHVRTCVLFGFGVSICITCGSMGQDNV